ncbi:MAG: rRNA pseudouridine synthase [Caulobacterales bacterium]|nr:rRNA pseudouridine synthase [Caulobacterales bacterium]
MTDAQANDDGERIAKVIARAGICSRREAERLIAEGRVTVDGHVLETPAVKVRPGQDVRVDGSRIGAPERARLFRYHKPPGLLVTNRDPQGRPTIFEALPEGLPRLTTVGRLDLNSEGLLLLTNDGALARRLELPATGWTRRYRARAFGQVEQARLDALRSGVVVDGERFGAIEARLERAQGGNVWVSVALKEGKKREVRRALETAGLRVNRLIRTAYGPFQLGKLERGEVAEVTTKQMRELLGGLAG